jgi:hypothetical protein
MFHLHVAPFPVRGIERAELLGCPFLRVAPFKGAWIATAVILAHRLGFAQVAPFTGAWIEPCRL